MDEMNRKMARMGPDGKPYRTWQTEFSQTSDPCLLGLALAKTDHPSLTPPAACVLAESLPK
jgi:hypothetical protein